MGPAKDDLQQCRRELFRLLNENAALRYAAKSFGDLAERLNLIVNRQRLGLLPSGFPDHGLNPCITESIMVKTPDDREHVESRIPSLDDKLHPGGAHAVPVDPGMTDLHRSDVPGLDSVEKPHEGRPAGDRRD